MKFKQIITTSIILLGLLVGCSSNFDEFNDEKIIFTVVDSESTSEYNSYTIDIKNETGFELTHLMFTMSYPIKTSNGKKGNPFVIEGKIYNTIPPCYFKI